MKLEPGTWIDFERERPFVRQLAQVVALVGLVAIAAHRHLPVAPGATTPVVASASDNHRPFAHVSLRPGSE